MDTKPDRLDVYTIVEPQGRTGNADRNCSGKHDRLGVGRHIEQLAWPCFGHCEKIEAKQIRGLTHRLPDDDIL